MDGDGRRAGVFGTLCHFNGIDIVVIPSDADLHGDRQIDRLHHCTDDLFGEHGILEQGGAAAVAGDFRGGTAHIDIDYVRRERERLARRVRHNLRVAAE